MNGGLYCCLNGEIGTLLKSVFVYYDGTVLATSNLMDTRKIIILANVRYN